MHTSPTVLITGANRGIGLGFTLAYLARGYQVIATCRHPQQAMELNHLTAEYKTQLHLDKLDVTVENDFARLKVKYADQPIDILINNAGVFPEDHERAGIAHTRYQQLISALTTNAAGALLTIQSFQQNLLRCETPKIINISSQMAALHHAKGFAYAYRMSKAALNMLTCSFAAENKHIITISLRPGWVKTAMGGSHANISVEESINKMITIIDGLTRDDSGTFLDNDKNHCAW